jgi:hypothetical protein
VGGGGAFIAPKGICPLGCQRHGYIWAGGRTYSATVSKTQPWNRINSALGTLAGIRLRGRTCLCWGRTCPKNVSRTWVGGRISLTKDLTTEGKLKPGHVRARGRTCPINASRIQSKIQICPATLGILVYGYDFMIFVLHQLTQCIPIGSTKLLGHN